MKTLNLNNITINDSNCEIAQVAVNILTKEADENTEYNLSEDIQEMDLETGETIEWVIVEKKWNSDGTLKSIDIDC